jgi:hypothetical protein
VRLASWALLLCAARVAVAVFVSSIELRPGGAALSKRTRASLYRIASHRALARRMLAAPTGCPGSGRVAARS